MRPKNIEIHIEELVLHDFEAGNHQNIGEVVERELSRLFTEQGAPQSLNRNGKIERLDGGAFKAKRGSKPETIGAKVAQAVHGGLSK